MAHQGVKSPWRVFESLKTEQSYSGRPKFFLLWCSGDGSEEQI